MEIVYDHDKASGRQDSADRAHDETMGPKRLFVASLRCLVLQVSNGGAIVAQVETEAQESSSKCKVQVDEGALPLDAYLS